VFSPQSRGLATYGWPLVSGLQRTCCPLWSAWISLGLLSGSLRALRVCTYTHNNQCTLFSVGDWPKNKRGDKVSNGGRNETQKEKSAAEAATRQNSTDCGIPFGCTKKDIVNIALVEDKAEARAHESSLLALAQVMESKQKRVANLTKI
jgi:hypothetical protein